MWEWSYVLCRSGPMSYVGVVLCPLYEGEWPFVGGGEVVCNSC